jgi:hypothetical protein
MVPYFTSFILCMNNFGNVEWNEYQSISYSFINNNLSFYLGYLLVIYHLLQFHHLLRNVIFFVENGYRKHGFFW